ncbi:MAG TPA: ferrous iron transport protein B [bacterium]
MHDHSGKFFVEKNIDTPRCLLVGNPNVGKSLIFSILTGKYVTVSNYPGTTVEISEGNGVLLGTKHIVIDTPGVNSLLPMSEDERVTRDIIMNTQDGVILQVADAKNLERALLISSQLAEIERPFYLILNMTDEAKNLGISVDSKLLEDALGIRVYPTVATRKAGFEEIMRNGIQGSTSSFRIEYPPEVDAGARKIAELLPPELKGRYGIALMLLAGDETLSEWLHRKLPENVIKSIDDIRSIVQKNSSLPLGYVINRSKQKNIQKLVSDVIAVVPINKINFMDRAGEFIMHPVWGLPVLLGVLAGIYYFVGVLGAQVIVDFLENTVFAKHLNPLIIRAVDAVIPFKHTHMLDAGIILTEYSVIAGQAVTSSERVLVFIHDLIIGPYGIITMALTYSIAIVFPIVGTFFIAFGILEDSGYLPRLAVMLNRVFRVLGLNGKAVLPMILGLGCDTMATITARILGSKKEKIIVTLLLALGVPCSAQLGVILGMLGGLSLTATLIWSGVVVGVILVVGYLASKIIPGKNSDFILEVPPVRIPQFSNIMIKTISRLEWYIKEAVPLFIAGTFLLFIMDRTGLLGTIEKLASPVVQGLLNLPAQTTGAFVIGFLRRDYGAAGLFVLAEQGLLTPNQIVVSLVTITLFVPCIANLLIIIKERGWKTAAGMTLFIFPFAFFVGAILNAVLKYAGIQI